MDGGGGRGLLELFLILIGKRAGGAKDKDRSRRYGGRDNVVNDGTGLCTAGYTSEGEHVFEVKPLWMA